jgi:hypothetical protein
MQSIRYIGSFGFVIDAFLVLAKGVWNSVFCARQHEMNMKQVSTSSCKSNLSPTGRLYMSMYVFMNRNPSHTLLM